MIVAHRGGEQAVTMFGVCGDLIPFGGIGDPIPRLAATVERRESRGGGGRWRGVPIRASRRRARNVAVSMECWR